ncbi:phospholipase [Alteromonas pelagimontana]|uniref:Phospholipase n=2 Tax=Alteromonas pelagimontana TaxID=1858656 RepID=A0A6M4MJG0_9ALTE|nr:phospholipase [Alteromonas pelagimontana]
MIVCQAALAQQPIPKLPVLKPEAPQNIDKALAEFTALYEQELGSVATCPQPKLHEFRLCSDKLRNAGNAPFILHHGKPTDNVVVLLHGLSDSPYFMQGIARTLYDKGYNVVVPLLAGNGLKDADADMEDDQLAERWQTQVDDIMALAPQLGSTIFIGGFSTGGALAVEHYLDSPDGIAGILLFSGALALSDNAENMAKIWGVKWVAKLVDGSYETDGPNPFKYPSVAGFAGLELMDIIDEIRADFEAGKRISVPIFAAHSQADATTPIEGIRNLLEHADGANTFFVIDESYQLCHADVPVNTKMKVDMHFDTSQVNEFEQCAVPKANPLYRQMTMMLQTFMDMHATPPTKQAFN